MTQSQAKTIQIAREAFSEIFAKFPDLKVTENKDDPVEISLTLNEQSGLKSKVWLSLQNNDELHFTAGNFWLEWFPCTNPQKVESYIDSVRFFVRKLPYS